MPASCAVSYRVLCAGRRNRSLPAHAADLPLCLLVRGVMLHANKPIRARWWSPDSINTSLFISEDGVAWTLLRNDLVPNALPVQELWYDTPLKVGGFRRQTRNGK